ncbi:hypothetical protein CORT_0C06060 [Candida orthopsilosis Co 90-125]|uniref:Uncharacterized protein n=1 Tax=Candida orthopsilosis (strain 90-125) TaxID=1136231 RepID=H8X427_CANO9|nr:hypothetical protein CORT_0C06060 [Candida orthopsilosis Co 90-125]CCG25979.1 hypothetical protein CORT_0C06060 [Candida orthopsilosis Co 90-125]
MPLQYSAAKTSSVSKNRSPSKSPIKKFQRDAKKLLPSQKVYKNNLSKAKPSSPPESPSKSATEKLQVQDYNVQLDYQLSSRDDVVVAVDTILSNRWSESTQLHDHYKTRDLAGTEEERVFQIKGQSSTSKAELIKYRHALPQGLITITQLYAIFHAQGPTFVDKSLELNIRRGILRKFIISNASPVISRSLHQFQSKKVTYGFEDIEVVAKVDCYHKLIEKCIVESYDKGVSKQAISKFYEFIKSHPTQMFISTSDFNNEEVSNLVQLGYITLTSNHFNEIEHNYVISYPGCGAYLKLVNEGRTWLVKTLNKIKHKEALEEELFKKWSGINFEGVLKLNNFRKPFYGYDLHWVLADALGSGIVEVFNTPVGRGWQLTGKI